MITVIEVIGEASKHRGDGKIKLMMAVERSWVVDH